MNYTIDIHFNVAEKKISGIDLTFDNKTYTGKNALDTGVDTLFFVRIDDKTFYEVFIPKNHSNYKYYILTEIDETRNHRDIPKDQITINVKEFVKVADLKRKLTRVAEILKKRDENGENLTDKAIEILDKLCDMMKDMLNEEDYTQKTCSNCEEATE
jgi:hypothetical protein